MTIRTVAQLLDPARISAGLLDEALRIGACGAVRACQAAAAPIRLLQLRQAVIASLPAALAVGLRECICHRWWPAYAPSGGHVVPFVEWKLQPTLEWLCKGWPAISLTLVATVRLEQPALSICHDRTRGTLTIGTERAWSSRLILAISDRGHGSAAATFHESRSEIHIECGPWPVQAPPLHEARAF